MIETKFFNSLRKGLLISGIISLIMGLLVLFYPGKSAGVVTILLGIAFVLIGLTYVFTTFSNEAGEHGWRRFGHLLLGILYLFVGIATFMNLGASTVSLALVLGVAVGILWLVEGVVTLTSLDMFPSRGWAIFTAILNILAGLALLFSPLMGSAVLWIFFGAWLVVQGIFRIITFFTSKKD